MLGASSFQALHADELHPHPGDSNGSAFMSAVVAAQVLSLIVSWVCFPITTAARMSSSDIPASIIRGTSALRHGSQLAAMAAPAETSKMVF
jgi:hypothetical protein